jgi:hypothetical protein
VVKSQYEIEQGAVLCFMKLRAAAVATYVFTVQSRKSQELRRTVARDMMGGGTVMTEKRYCKLRYRRDSSLCSK